MKSKGRTQSRKKPPLMSQRRPLLSLVDLQKVTAMLHLHR